MNEKNVNRALRGGARALTGVLVIGVAAASAVILGSATLPSIEREPVSFTVDTLRGAERQFVCAGSFAELGADASRPGVAIPVGVAAITFAGQASAQTELERDEPGGSSPAVIAVPAEAAFAAAQTQSLASDTLRGRTAAACTEPSNEQWLVGGTTVVGASTTLNLGNPADVPATVQLTIYDERGEIDSSLTTGVLVPARSERVVSLNGYAPGRERLAVRVDSTGAAVTASLGIGQVSGLQPFGVDTVTRQLAGETTLVVPGVANLSDHEHGPGDTGESDAYPVLVRALSTTGANGSASVSALFADGTSEALGTLELVGAAVGELSVAHWPAEAAAVVIDADVPIVGGVLGSATAGPDHDNAWFAPAPALRPGLDAFAAIVTGGQLVLANPGGEDAEVTISSAAAAADAETGAGAGADAGADQTTGGSAGSSDAGAELAIADQTVTVPAGGALVVSVPAAARISASTPIHAAVRVASGGDIAGYPVLGEPARVTSLTVYPR